MDQIPETLNVKIVVPQQLCFVSSVYPATVTSAQH